MYNKTKKRIRNTILGTALSFTMVLPGIVVTTPAVTAEAAARTSGNSYNLADNIQDGVILHCFNWKYSDIEAELPAIAEAGFTSVQTSPAQPSVKSGTWYWLYQPLGFYVGTNDLGSKDDLEDLCDEAEKYNINVIVDVVANHLAGDHSNIQSDLKDSQYWHTYGGVSSWADRYQVTHGEIGMPDLNSEHPYVYQTVSNYIDELQDLGVDGIRWDAAKHIGLPSEGCNFWPEVTDQGLYHYGEILVGPDDRTSGNEGLMKEYTNYMTVTDSNYGKTLRDAFAAGTVPTAYGNWSARGISNDKLIYWSESHDTWSNNQDWGYSNGMSQNVIDRAYAVAASRNDISALYFSRPSSANKEDIKAGVKGSTHFTSDEVSAVNQFHNAMDGQADYYTTGNNCAVVSRETGAVVVAGSGGNFNVTVPNGGKTTQAGTYVDAITGEKWTVSSESMSGKIGSTGIAVLYKEGTLPDDPDGPDDPVDPTETSTVYYENTNNWNDVYAYYWSDKNTQMTTWPGVPMTNVQDNAYSVDIPSDAKYIIFSNKGSSQTEDLTIAGENMIYNNGNWSAYSGGSSEIIPEEPEDPEDPENPENGSIFYRNTNNWNDVYIYYWSDENTQMTTWPGVPMTNTDNNVYKAEIPTDAQYVIFSNKGNSQTSDLTLDGYGKIYDNGTWSSYSSDPGDATADGIYYQNTNNWNTVYAYYWSSSNTQMATWPGVKMTNVSSGVWKIDVPEEAEYIIFTNGSGQQTGDLTINGTGKIYNNNGWSDYS
ncbi:MAG TPA: starch-binding protein [Candidatus Mediterraneibacter intestinigallinarum]|nr:starch-binding protein [Candidatus Mediterraneibacter intestinigallinarum]